jgi:branched-chain amino acid transport system permease protein
LLRAASQDEVAARAAGVSIPRQRLLAWCIGAFFMAIGGVLYAHFVGVISVNYFYLNMTFITLAMLIVGGRKSLAGAVIGTVVLTGMTELFRQFEEGFTIGTMKLAIPEGSEEVFVAALMILILIIRPDGLTGGREIGWPGRKKLTHAIR